MDRLLHAPLHRHRLRPRHPALPLRRLRLLRPRALRLPRRRRRDVLRRLRGVPPRGAQLGPRRRVFLAGVSGGGAGERARRGPGGGAAGAVLAGGGAEPGDVGVHARRERETPVGLELVPVGGELARLAVLPRRGLRLFGDGEERQRTPDQEDRDDLHDHEPFLHHRHPLLRRHLPPLRHPLPPLPPVHPPGPQARHHFPARPRVLHAPRLRALRAPHHRDVPHVPRGPGAAGADFCRAAVRRDGGRAAGAAEGRGGRGGDGGGRAVVSVLVPLGELDGDGREGARREAKDAAVGLTGAKGNNRAFLCFLFFFS
mmetsp:Transcript_5256/g.12625  ORF Transcript_5256/g.12625 Transcript_5256/m.12625 type:complete len:314 (+) Transcript_5256:414-1355(+)